MHTSFLLLAYPCFSAQYEFHTSVLIYLIRLPLCISQDNLMMAYKGSKYIDNWTILWRQRFLSLIRILIAMILHFCVHYVLLKSGPLAYFCTFSDIRVESIFITNSLHDVQETLTCRAGPVCLSACYKSRTAEWSLIKFGWTSCSRILLQTCIFWIPTINTPNITDPATSWEGTTLTPRNIGSSNYAR
jgi:hypothetical protein